MQAAALVDLHLSLKLLSVLAGVQVLHVCDALVENYAPQGNKEDCFGPEGALHGA